MTTCPSCSTENAVDASFCEACGVSLDTPGPSGFPGRRDHYPSPSLPSPAKGVAGIAKAIQVLLIISAVVMTIRIPTRLNAWSKLGAFIDRGSFSNESAFVDAIAIDYALSVPHFGIMVALFVLFIILGHRMTTNAIAWRARPQVTPGMAIGSWFIPVYCVVGPYNAIAGAHRLAGNRDSTNTGHSIILWWWLLFVAAQVIGDWLARVAAVSANTNTVGGVNAQSEALDSLRGAIAAQFVGQLLLIASAIVGFFAVKTIAARQQERLLSTSSSEG